MLPHKAPFEQKNILLKVLSWKALMNEFAQNQVSAERSLQTNVLKWTVFVFQGSYVKLFYQNDVPKILFQ